MLSAPISANAIGAAQIVAAPVSPTQFIRVHGYVVNGAGAVLVTWQGTPTKGNVSGAMDLAAAGQTIVAPVVREGWFDLAPGDALKLNLSAAIQVSGHVTYSIQGV